MDNIVERFFKGDKRAVARIISMIENEEPRAKKILSEIYPNTGRAHIVGITGPPGAGKSTLLDKLTLVFRRSGKTVGIVAVDPTSPFTDGALLGDRIRMGEIALDPGVFIRSMGTRGCVGGLAKATNDVVKVLDAFGKDIIIVETVGAGQSEVDIVKMVHTSVVVEVPGLGDDIQAIKAGILEIGDIFVVNKADREGADRTARELQVMLELSEKGNGWKPPVIKTIARTGEGIEDLASAIERHREYLKNSGEWSKIVYTQTKEEFMEILKEDIKKYIIEKAIEHRVLDDLVRKIAVREIDPYSAAEALLKPLKKEIKD